MSRLDGAPRREGPLTRLTLWVSRRKLAKLTGRETERMIEPLRAYARAPWLLLGYGMLETATAKLHQVEERLKVLAELKAATLTHCEYCIDVGSQIARRAGVSEAQLLALSQYHDSECFDELEKLVLDYAAGMSRTPAAVSDELFARLRSHFDEAQLVELTNVIALENMRGRFNVALDIGSAGFSKGMVCAVPATQSVPRAEGAPRQPAKPAADATPGRDAERQAPAGAPTASASGAAA
jgi:AhpD family alkylhydroperoxidase